MINTTITKLATPYRLKLQIPNDDLIKLVDEHWNVIKDSIVVDGFRKGKVPQTTAEEKLGFQQLYKDIIPKVYAKEIKDLNVIYNEKYEVYGHFNRQGSIIIESILYLFPKCEIPDLTKIKDKKPSVCVTQEEIDNEVQSIVKKHRIRKEKKVANIGNDVVFDFSGSVDGKLLQNAQAKNYKLTLGENKFIKGFEEGLVGKSINQTFYLDLVFPENYYATELAGKPVKFEVKIHKVFEYEEKSLEQIANEHNQTVEVLIESVKTKLLDMRELEVTFQYRSGILKQLVELSHMEEIPEQCVQKELESKFSSYLETTGTTEESLPEGTKQWFMNTKHDAIVQGIKGTLLLHRLSDEYNIQINDEEFVLELKEKYSEEIVDAILKNEVRKANEYDRIITNRTLDYVIEQIEV